jgi:hypothetical protein
MLRPRERTQELLGLLLGLDQGGALGHEAVGHVHLEVLPSADVGAEDDGLAQGLGALVVGVDDGAP